MEFLWGYIRLVSTLPTCEGKLLIFLRSSQRNVAGFWKKKKKKIRAVKKIFVKVFLPYVYVIFIIFTSCTCIGLTLFSRHFFIFLLFSSSTLFVKLTRQHGNYYRSKYFYNILILIQIYIGDIIVKLWY